MTKNNRQAIIEAGDRRDWDECERLEGIDDTATPDDEPITPALLGSFDFKSIHLNHMNPKWIGGYMKWVKEISEIMEFSLCVTFGCHYCLRDQVEFIVWVTVGGMIRSEVALYHIKTAGQLRQLWLTLSGEEPIEFP